MLNFTKAYNVQKVKKLNLTNLRHFDHCQENEWHEQKNTFLQIQNILFYLKKICKKIKYQNFCILASRSSSQTGLGVDRELYNRWHDRLQQNLLYSKLNSAI